MLGRGTFLSFDHGVRDLDRGRFRGDRVGEIPPPAPEAPPSLLAEILHREWIRNMRARSPRRNRRLGGILQGFEPRRSVFRGSLLGRSSSRG